METPAKRQVDYSIYRLLMALTVGTRTSSVLHEDIIDYTYTTKHVAEAIAMPAVDMYFSHDAKEYLYSLEATTHEYMSRLRGGAKSAWHDREFPTPNVQLASTSFLITKEDLEAVDID